MLSHQSDTQSKHLKRRVFWPKAPNLLRTRCKSKLLPNISSQVQICVFQITRAPDGQSQEKTQCWLSIISPTHRFLPSFYILIWGVCLILVLAGTHILSYLGWWLSFLLIDIEKSHWCQYVKIHSMVMVRVKQNHWKTIVSNDARKKNITIAPFGKN